jgi:ferric-dicitrate binding protein FerR (iron transport regulator)
MDELLTKYMLNETSPVENETISRWLEQSEDNRRYFNHFKLIWDTARDLKIESNLDPETLWAEFKQLATDANPTAIVKPINQPKRWLRVAAIWLSILGCAALIYTLNKPGKPNLLTLQSNNVVRKITLADSSVITLNKTSQLIYPDHFAGNTREVDLKGEAFFEVAHDKSKPFMIHVNGVTVRVVGTSFNIKSAGDSTEVIVETGIVQVMQQDVEVRLKPKEKVVVKSGKLKKANTQDDLYNYYRTQKFVANNTPLWRLVEVLNEVYHVNIVIDNKKTGNRVITTTFKADSLDNILKVIKGTLGVEIIRKPHLIIIK